ncbi:MAG: hypothetical protein AB1540_02725 [Bdellovibrionota bacterium]
MLRDITFIPKNEIESANLPKSGARLVEDCEGYHLQIRGDLSLKRQVILLKNALTSLHKATLASILMPDRLSAEAINGRVTAQSCALEDKQMPALWDFGPTLFEIEENGRFRVRVGTLGPAYISSSCFERARKKSANPENNSEKLGPSVQAALNENRGTPPEEKIRHSLFRLGLPTDPETVNKIALSAIDSEYVKQSLDKFLKKGIVIDYTGATINGIHYSNDQMHEFTEQQIKELGLRDSFIEDVRDRQEDLLEAFAKSYSELRPRADGKNYRFDPMLRAIVLGHDKNGK